MNQKNTSNKNHKQFFKSMVEFQKDSVYLATAHVAWRNWSFQRKKGFFPVFMPEFVKKFKNVSGNALKLFFFLASYTTNQDGYTFISIDAISKEMNVSKRSIQTWFQELISHQMILRIQPGFRQPTFTCFLPYHDEFLKQNPILCESIDKYASLKESNDGVINSDSDELIIKFSNPHKEWRQWCFQNKKGFFPVFTPEFVDKFKEVSGNALRLYLYLGAHINNREGYTLLAIETIAKEYKATKRTVHNWFQELRDNRLLLRIQPGFKQPTYTYLLPYHEQFLDLYPGIQELINEYMVHENYFSSGSVAQIFNPD